MAILASNSREARLDGSRWRPEALPLSRIHQLRKERTNSRSLSRRRPTSSLASSLPTGGRLPRRRCHPRGAMRATRATHPIHAFRAVLPSKAVSKPYAIGTTLGVGATIHIVRFLPTLSFCAPSFQALFTALFLGASGPSRTTPMVSQKTTTLLTSPLSWPFSFSFSS